VLKPFDLLENILIDIEQGIREGINIGALAEKYTLSERHLQRLFKFAFNQTIAGYIRSRKLAASIDDLLNTDLNILDIALDYDFEYEQSYIRSFRREYGITPGDLRKTGKILKITPPLQLFNEQKYPNGVMFGPEIVVIPQFHVVGRKHKMSFRDGMVVAHSLGKQFFLNDRPNIPNTINRNTHIVITSEAENGADYYYSMPSVQVKTLKRIPKGFDGYTFPTSLCARFRFINNNTDEFNLHIADRMFRAINDFMDSEDQKYFLERKRVDIGIADLSDKDGRIHQLEWFSPVIKKTSLKIPPFSPSGIKKVYQQELPALRFIGKKCIETSEPVKVLNLLDSWQLNRWFDAIEKQSSIDYKAFFEGGDAYINLVQKKDGLFTYWMGMFVPDGTEVPQGYEAIDFSPMTIGVCSVYGKRDEIVNYETECRAIDNAPWYFRRFNWHRFFGEDVYGKRLLDYCYPVM
jgi:AraC family transcriptional regulator